MGLEFVRREAVLVLLVVCLRYRGWKCSALATMSGRMAAGASWSESSVST